MRGSSSEPKLNKLRPSPWLFTSQSIRCISRPVVAHLTLQIFLKIRSSGAHSEATQSPRHGFLILTQEINKKFPHEQMLLKADKQVRVDKLIGVVRGQGHFISHGRNTNESHELSNRVQNWLPCQGVDPSGVPTDPNVDDTCSTRIGVPECG